MTSRTYNTTQAENPLCQRMQRQFRDRVGSAVRAGSRTETSEMLARVRQGLDPYENVPNPSRRTVSEVRSTSGASARNGAARVQPRPAESRRSAATGASRPSVSSAPRSAQMSAVANGSRSRSAARPAAGAQRSYRTQVQSSEAKTGGFGAVLAFFDSCKEKRRALKLSRSQLKDGELEVTAPFPLAGVCMLTLFTVMALVLILSFTQNYELQGEISALHDDAYRLQQLERSMEIQLEERDDIRTIERIAVEELGMVKYDLVESRFVSVSGGDRMELTEEDAQAVESGLWSTMLSAVGRGFSRIREYIE